MLGAERIGVHEHLPTPAVSADGREISFPPPADQAALYRNPLHAAFLSAPGAAGTSATMLTVPAPVRDVVPLVTGAAGAVIAAAIILWRLSSRGESAGGAAASGLPHRPHPATDLDDPAARAAFLKRYGSPPR